MVKMKTFQKVLNYFNGDLNKTELWFKTPNPALDDIKPNDMPSMGRHDRLDNFIDNSLDGILP